MTDRTARMLSFAVLLLISAGLVALVTHGVLWGSWW